MGFELERGSDYINNSMYIIYIYMSILHESIRCYIYIYGIFGNVIS